MGIRRRLIILVVSATCFVSLGLGMSAYGVGLASGRALVTAASPPSSVQISGNYSFTGAVITGPGLAKPRKLNAYQAAVYVQSWLADTVFGKGVVRQSPPANLPVYRVDVAGFWGGNTATLATYYASDGTQVWIAFPRQPTSTSTPSTRPPNAAGWFVALPRVKQAFEGTAKLVPTAGIAQSPGSTGAGAPTTVGAATPNATASSGSSGSATPWVIGIVALVLALSLALFAGYKRIRRGRSPAGSNAS